VFGWKKLALLLGEGIRRKQRASEGNKAEEGKGEKDGERR